MLIKLIAIMLLAALLLPMLGGIRRIRDLPKTRGPAEPALRDHVAGDDQDDAGEGADRQN